ncbi:MAG: glycosyltransferase family 2 protein [Candidatus Moranbacteria bacterium]|nr:glycosyltransferase family 2 protein [Candidatus Moranbacteria bacterium]
MVLSFIIVNYQSEKYLENCISSIKEKVLSVDYEIIVVNNDNGNLEAKLANEIKVIKSEENIGFGAANNIGAREAKGEILCFLNPDTKVISEDIKSLLDEFDKNDKLAIIGPKLLSDKNEVQWWCAGKEVTVWSIILNNLGYRRDKKIWESSKKIKCAWVSGAAMFIRREVFEKLGGFDEKFFMYFEDIDLCKKVRIAGYKVLYYPNFAIKHFGGRSFSLDRKAQKCYYYKSQKYFLRKWLISQ